MTKRSILFVMVACIGGVACGAVQLLENGGFEADPWIGQFNEGNQNYPTGWSGWGGDGWHVTAGNANDAPFILGEKAITIYAGGTGVHQPLPASEEDFFIFEGQINHPAVDPYGTGGPNGGALTGTRHAILRIEFWTGPWDPDPALSGVLISSVEVGNSNGDDPSETWMAYRGAAQAPAGTGEVRFAASVYDEPGTVVDGKVYFDALAAYAPDAHQADRPQPGYGAAVATTLDVLSWTPPDPNRPGDEVLCDVLLVENEPNFTPGFPTLVTFPDKEDSVSFVAEGYALKPDTVYFWRVDCHDPSVGTTEGMVWTFDTGDMPPTVDAGSDQYVWLDMADGDGDDGSVTISLAGVLEDDAKSEVALQWILNYSEAAEGTNVVIAEPDRLETTVTIDDTGWFQFLLTADDALAHDEDVVHVGVYNSACEAVKADPDDRYNHYPGGLSGDINGDCATDLEDLAIVATTWLDCMSDKLDCNE